jgi:hypothetical protein
MRRTLAPAARVAGVTGIVLFAALTLTLFSATRDIDHRGSFAVAVLRRDGFLIPFAAFDGKRWRGSWPAPSLDLRIPINLASVPKAWWGPTPPLSEWQTWIAATTKESAGGSAWRSGTIHVVQPDWIDAHCLRQVALRTDYRSEQAAPPPPTEQPYPKDGLAISPPQALERIEIVPLGEAPPLVPGLRERFNKAELETDREFGHPVPRRLREGAEPTIEALYAFGDRPRAYYVEANRTYLNASDGRCVAIGFATGWLVNDGDSPKWLDMAVDILRCNKYGATYMLPLGALRMNERTFWIAQYSGWDHERYIVAEVKKDKIESVVNAWGGGC